MTQNGDPIGDMSMERHTEEGGDMYTHTTVLGQPGGLQLGQSKTFLICLSPGEEILDVALVFLDRTDLSTAAQIVED